MLRTTLQRVVCAVSATLLICAPAFAADDLGGLPRRGMLGASLAPPVPGEAGIEILQVVPKSPAARAGLEVEDLLLSIEGAPVTSGGEVVRLVARSAGKTLALKISRSGGEMEIAVPIDTLPLESSDKFEVIYDSVDVGDFKVRCIYTHPKGDGPFPGFFMIQGVGCGTIDVPGNQIHPSKEIAHRLAERGYATMRVEKSSMGDSLGPPCDELDFHLETEIFRRALDKFAHEPFVDPDRITLFGHSMGGIIAPILATETKVAGVCAYGTYAYPWLEYLSINARRQYDILGGDPVALEGQLRATWKFHSLLMGEEWTPEQIREKYPELASFMQPPFGSSTGLFGRHYKFWQQMEATPILQQWRDCQTRVLTVWGECDVVTSRAEHEFIAATVNVYSPGNGEFKALANADHAITRYETPRAAFLEPDPQAPFVAEFIDVLDDWMKSAPSKTVAQAATN